MSDIRLLEQKLNNIIDDEFSKPDSQFSCETVAECVNTLLRADTVSNYYITKKLRDENVRSVTGKVKANGRNLSRKAKIILVAAIIAALLVISGIAYGQIEYNIFYKPESFGFMLDKKGDKIKGLLNVGYLPEGYEVVVSENDAGISLHTELYNGEDSIHISVDIPHGTYDFDVEHGAPVEKVIDGKKYTFFGGESGNNLGLIYADERYIYVITGHISEDEMIKLVNGLSLK